MTRTSVPHGRERVIRGAGSKRKDGHQRAQDGLTSLGADHVACRPPGLPPAGCWRVQPRHAHGKGPVSPAGLSSVAFFMMSECRVGGKEEASYI